MYLTPAHPFTITDTPDGREYTWAHPAACVLRDGLCEVERRINRSGRQGADVCDDLADGRPAGDYLIGLYHFHGLVLVDAAGQMLPTPATAGDAVLTPEREQEIRTLDLLDLMPDRAAAVVSGHLAALLAEVDRLRASSRAVA